MSNSNFAITVGRWGGIFWPVWYADVVHEYDDRPYMTFNSFSKRRAMRKATHYVQRVIGTVNYPYGKHEVYVFDMDEDRWNKIDV